MHDPAVIAKHKHVAICGLARDIIIFAPFHETAGLPKAGTIP
jgi:hypothetical protein